MKMLILAGLFVSASFADTVDFSSSASTPNSTGLPSIVASNSAWATALSSPIASTWITATGDVDPPNGTTVTFTVSFTTPASLSSAFLSLGVLADDTATVKIDNTTLFAEDTTLGSVCAAGVIGCISGNEGILNNVNVTADLAPGSSHTITVQAFQLGGGTFGVDFDGAITTNTATTPEPASALPLGAGLLVGIGLLRRRASKCG
jgi:MYXO-CTERM domain-containing protein